MAKKRALITGITGQDGAYLAEFLLSRGYEVFGGCRNDSPERTWRLQELGITNKIDISVIDLLDVSSIESALKRIRPSEVYNLAAQSFIGVSFEQPVYTAEIDGMAVARLLESIRVVCPKTRFLQASSSEIFGGCKSERHNESSLFQPRNPYAAAKVFAQWLTVIYRDSYGLYASTGILFNHESPLRGPEFVTRKICRGLAEWICLGQQPLQLGNLQARRDWGFAGDYVQALWKILQQEQPTDYVLATGQTHTVKQFVDVVARALEIELSWSGKEGLETGATELHSGKTVIEVDHSQFRLADDVTLTGDASKANRDFGWQPNLSFEEMATMMAKAELVRVKACDQATPK